MSAKNKLLSLIRSNPSLQNYARSPYSYNKIPTNDDEWTKERVALFVKNLSEKYADYFYLEKMTENAFDEVVANPVASLEIQALLWGIEYYAYFLFQQEIKNIKQCDNLNFEETLLNTLKKYMDVTVVDPLSRQSFESAIMMDSDNVSQKQIEAVLGDTIYLFSFLKSLNFPYCSADIGMKLVFAENPQIASSHFESNLQYWRVDRELGFKLLLLKSRKNKIENLFKNVLDFSIDLKKHVRHENIIYLSTNESCLFDNKNLQGIKISNNGTEINLPNFKSLSNPNIFIAFENVRLCHGIIIFDKENNFMLATHCSPAAAAGQASMFEHFRNVYADILIFLDGKGVNNVDVLVLDASSGFNEKKLKEILDTVNCRVSSLKKLTVSNENYTEDNDLGLDIFIKSEEDLSACACEIAWRTSETSHRFSVREIFEKTSLDLEKEKINLEDLSSCLAAMVSCALN